MASCCSLLQAKSDPYFSHLQFTGQKVSVSTGAVIEKAEKMQSFCVLRKRKNEMELCERTALPLSKNEMLEIPEEARALQTEICHIH